MDTNQIKTANIHKKSMNKKRKLAASNVEKSVEMNVEMLSPFGPFMMKAKLPDKILNRMIEITDDITNDEENKKNWGHALAGQIRDEPLIANEYLDARGLYNYFNNLCTYYIDHTIKINNVDVKMIDPETNSKITSMWIVNQKEGEYNPVHHHTNATISCVMYLKIPEYTPRDLPYKPISDGSIEFIYSASGEEYQTFNKGCYLTSPEVGDMFMFPSYLLHTVYPFLGDGERRSVSFNAIHWFVDKELQKEQVKEENQNLKSELAELKEQVAQLAKAK